MIAPAYALLMARYNRWMNQRLYALAATLDDTQRRADRGAFFGSLHNTLAHLVFTDTLWLRRFRGETIERADVAPFEAMSFDALTTERERLDAEILAWSETLTETVLAGELSYYSFASQRHFVLPMTLAVTHFFNHQTHHRGQVTTLLSQCGLDPGVTDLPMLPADP